MAITKTEDDDYTGMKKRKLHISGIIIRSIHFEEGFHFTRLHS